MDRNITITHGEPDLHPYAPAAPCTEARIQAGLGHRWEAWYAGVQKSSSAQYHWEGITGAPLRVRISVGFARRGPGTSDVRSPSARTVTGTKDK
jgi:hypothetical protein